MVLVHSRVLKQKLTEKRLTKSLDDDMKLYNFVKTIIVKFLINLISFILFFNIPISFCFNLSI